VNGVPPSAALDTLLVVDPMALAAVQASTVVIIDKPGGGLDAVVVRDRWVGAITSPVFDPDQRSAPSRRTSCPRAAPTIELVLHRVRLEIGELRGLEAVRNVP
jgi:hypothetical protein